VNLEGLGLSEHSKRRIRGDIDFYMTVDCFEHAVPILGRDGEPVCYVEEWPHWAYQCADHPRLPLMMWSEYEAYLAKVSRGVLTRPCPLCGGRSGYWRQDAEMAVFFPTGFQTVMVVDGSDSRTVSWGGQITLAVPPTLCRECDVDIRTWPK
jgi:hypothetical protein